MISLPGGGEEFAVYLPDKRLDYALKVANNIRQKVLHGTSPRVSISCGVSTWSFDESDSIEKLFVRADEGLYEAKNTGKNKIVVVQNSSNQSI